MGGGDDPVVLVGDERLPLDDPAVDDELAGLGLEMAEQRLHRQGGAGQDGGDVGVDQSGQLVPVGPYEGADLGGHAELLGE